MSKVEYVPYEVVKTEYKAKIDTTIIRDSVWVEKWTKKDTVYLTKEKYKYLTKIQRDTVFKVDTIPVIKEVKVDVPYVPNYYRKINFWFWSIVGTIVAYIILSLWLKRK